jgi:hypothetical protein
MAVTLRHTFQGANGENQVTMGNNEFSEKADFIGKNGASDRD